METLSKATLRKATSEGQFGPDLEAGLPVGNFSLSTSGALWNLADELQTYEVQAETGSLALSASSAAWDLASLQDDDTLSEASDDTEELVTPTSSPVLGAELEFAVETVKIVIHECEGRDEEEDPNFGETINDGPLQSFPLPVWNYLPTPVPSFNAPRPKRVSRTHSKRPLPTPPLKIVPRVKKASSFVNSLASITE